MEPPEGYEGREVQLQSKTVCRDCEYLSALLVGGTFWISATFDLAEGPG